MGSPRTSGRSGGDLDGQGDVAADQFRGDHAGFLQHGADLHRGEGRFGAAGEHQDLAQQSGAALGVLADDAGAPGDVGRGAGFDAFGIQGDGHEQVVDIVDDAAGELAEQLDALGAQQLLLKLFAVGGIAEGELKQGAVRPGEADDRDLGKCARLDGELQGGFEGCEAVIGAAERGESSPQGRGGGGRKTIEDAGRRRADQLDERGVGVLDQAGGVGEDDAVGGVGDGRLEPGLFIAEPAKTVELRDGANAGPQLDEIDGLVEEFVGAGLEAAQAELTARQAGEENDRDVAQHGVGPQVAADIEAIEAGHHNIEEHDVRRRQGGHGERIVSVLREQNAMARLLFQQYSQY